MTKPLRRMRDFAEIMDAERAALIDPSITTMQAMTESQLLAKVAKAICNVTYEEISVWARSERSALEALEDSGFVVSAEDWRDAWEKSDAKAEMLRPNYGDVDDPAGFDAEVIKAYRAIGWDATNELGQVLLVAANLLVPFMAAANGVGEARFPEEGSETAKAWAAKITLKPKPKAPSAPTPIITEEERRRRNAEARNSTVWRPEPKKRP